MYKIIKSPISIALSCLFLIIISACTEEYNKDNDEPGGLSSNSSELVPPSDVSARIVDSGVEISWTPIYNDYIDGYVIFRRNSSFGGEEVILGYVGNGGIVTGHYAVDKYPSEGYNHYRVGSIHRTGSSSYYQSKLSKEVSIKYNSGDGDNPGGGGDNPGVGGDNSGGGNGGGTQQKPSAPTGVSVSNEGNSYVPDVRVRWNSVSDATSYYIYKSSSATGSYSKIGETSYAQYGFSDSNAPTNGASAYYKVKAVNSAGESAFSNYAKYTSAKNDEAFSPAYTYGNCSVSGNTITLRWTNSTGYGYGKATKIVLRVWNPYAEEWQDTDVSATATSASFNFSTKIDDSGYVKAGIVVSNAKGSFTAGAKIYDSKNKRWLN